MTKVLMVQTCKRPGNYVKRTLASLDVDQWPGPRVLVGDGYDPRDEYDTKGWDVEVWPQVGSAHTRLRMYLLATEMQGVTSLTYLEDDVVVVRNGLEYMAQCEFRKEWLYMAWFTLRAPPRPGHFFDVISMRDYCRNTAFTVSMETLREIVSNDTIMSWPLPLVPGMSPMHSSDGTDSIFRRYWPDALCAVHYPNLVQHIGEVTTVEFQKKMASRAPQVSPSFPGEAFDAREWMV